MRNLTSILTVILFILGSCYQLSSQNISFHSSPEKETDGYLIYLDPEISQSQLDSLLNKYNSREIWITKYSKIRYWKVIEFPFTINDTLVIGNIQELQETWINDGSYDNEHKSKNSIKSLSYNYKIKKEISDIVNESEPEYKLNQCSKYFTPFKKGKSNVLINVLDTGFDFKIHNSNINSISILGGYNFITNSLSAQDDNGHGTHITSLISSLTSSYDKEKISVYESKTHNNQGYGKLSDIIRAIDYSIDINTNIINASWSFYAKESEKQTPLQIAIEKAGEYGILFVTATGNSAIDIDNDTLKSFPASYSSQNILSVSSNSCDTTLSYFSNYGFKNSDICALGENIPGFILNGKIALLSGTSQATAYVSSIAALIGTYLPIFDPIEVKEFLLKGSVFNDNLSGLIQTEGIVDFNNSLQLINNDIIPNEGIILKNKAFENDNIFIVYPSSFIEYINVNINSTRDQYNNIDIIDISGKTIISKKYHFTAGLNKIRIENLAKIKPGIYYLKIGHLKKKIIKI